MPRYIVNVDLHVRPAMEEEEQPVVIEISEERAAPLLAQGALTLAPSSGVKPEEPKIEAVTTLEAKPKLQSSEKAGPASARKKK